MMPAVVSHLLHHHHRTISPILARSSLLLRVSERRNMASTTMTGGRALKKLASENPHIEIIRYHHKNAKWTLRHVDFYSEALATGLVELGLIPGDVVLSWLPSHFNEQHIIQFACSKAGFLLYCLDPAIAIKDLNAAKLGLASALELTNANVLITQEAGDDVDYVRLVEQVIPETRIFIFAEGMPFITPRYPHLRFPVHTGFDDTDKHGFVPLKHLVSPSGSLPSLIDVNKLDGNTPLAGELVMDASGAVKKIGKILTNDEVVRGNVWPEFTSVLKKEYQEIEGVGVIF